MNGLIASPSFEGWRTGAAIDVEAWLMSVIVGSRVRSVNLDMVREHADPQVRKQHEIERRQEAARYGSAIRKVREEKGLKQSDVPRLSDRQVRRLEEGDTVPHADTLKKLAAAHGMQLDDYMKELAKRSRARSKAPKGR